ncbi:alpha/beta hydrolase [uncultured Limosilactobacillus sp.]|uniref:alpha/beta hydrolase n=1 Tax=uncultured Limosilactobacillus sp. TaxID=2837629 RepID=UPI0025F26F89|nr:alpha/beta hydrolase [uncultured Limosilactobacillus sp.]
MRKRWWWLIIILLVASLGVSYYTGHLFARTVTYQPQEHRPKIGTPTFLFHGYGSSYHAEEYMVNGAVKEGITSNNAVIRANVRPNGQVKLTGKIKAASQNPIVEVNFDNSRNGNYRTDGRWVRNVIVTLQNHYRFKRINLVGHSMGNMAIMYYLRQYGNDRQLPILNKQVAIAGHFNGLVMADTNKNHDRLAKNGRPLNNVTKQYRYLERLRRTYPRSAAVLNIYGNKGQGTDGDLTIQSAQSLKYLVAPRAKSYQEQEMKGKMASHSRLHSNPDVNALLNSFLWNRTV